MKQLPAKTLINGFTADYLSINDRAIHYGDGLFETILCGHSKLYYWKQHFQRLLNSAKILQLDCPSEQVLLSDIQKLLQEYPDHENRCFALKIIISRGSGERGYRFAANNSVTRIISLSELNIEYSSFLSSKLLTGDLTVCRQQVSINENLAGIKHLNRLDNVLARNEWHDEYLDGLMLNANRFVIEGTMSNLFAVKNNQLFTPDLSQSGVDGIMRNEVMTIAHNNNIKSSTVNLGIDEISTMDEVFISNSLIGMKAISKLVTPSNPQGFSFSQHDITNILFNELLTTKESYVQAVN